MPASRPYRIRTALRALNTANLLVENQLAAIKLETNGHQLVESEFYLISQSKTGPESNSFKH